MTIHEKPSTRFNKNLKKVYEMLDKYGTKDEDVDKVFNRATLKERMEMVKLLREGMEVELTIPKKKLKEDSEWNDEMPGYYGESIFEMLDEMSGDQIQMFMNEYDLWDALNLPKGASTDSIYDAINRYLDTDPGYGLYRRLSNFN
jgi:hypothetical protein